MVPRVPDNPVAALGAVPAGTVSGGHSWAQAPVHVEFPVVSVVKWYKVWPLDETSTAPTLALVAADTFGLLCPLVAAVEFGDDDELAPVVVLEHAESTIAVTARRMPVTDREERHEQLAHEDLVIEGELRDRRGAEVALVEEAAFEALAAEEDLAVLLRADDRALEGLDRLGV